MVLQPHCIACITTFSPQCIVVSQVALECLSVLKESLSWLVRNYGKGQELEFGKSIRPGQAQLQEPGHGSHVARDCVASTLPAVIDCFSRASLRGPAEDVLAECVAEQVKIALTRKD